jgi:hypothetical protein
MTSIALVVITLVAAATIFIRGLFSFINNMTRHTQIGFRIAWICMTTGSFGILLSPLFTAYRPTMWETILLVGLAVYVAFNRRQRQPI